MNDRIYPHGERGRFDEHAPTSFTLPSRYYHDPDIHRSELTRIFHRNWCYLGHVNQLRKPGDYRVDQIADQCVFLVRVNARTIKAFYNVCQHRGHQLLRDQGHTGKKIVCPYHAWAYRLDGRLLNAPHTHRLPDFDPVDYGLREITLATCRGLLFGNLDPDAKNFVDDFSGLETIFDSHLPQLETFAPAYRLQFDIAANWKVVVDNFSEGYHIPVAHKRLSQVLESGADNRAIIKARYAFFVSKSRAGYAGLELEPGLPYLSWTLWPNTCMLSQPGCENLIVIRMAPNGPTRCLESADILSPGGATNSNLDALKELFAENFNLEDIGIVESVQQGLHSLGYDQSRYVADDTEAWYSEAGLHRFHRLVLEALE